MQRLFVHNRSIVRFSGIAIGLPFILMVLSVRTTACPFELPTATISIKGHILTVELATTPAARSCGLSRRDELPHDRGMLFIFPDTRPVTFWMKDTRIPLSIAFLDGSGKILNIQNMVPMQTEDLYPSYEPAKYALEVNQGWFKTHWIDAGDRIVMDLPLVLDIK